MIYVCMDVFARKIMSKHPKLCSRMRMTQHFLSRSCITLQIPFRSAQNNRLPGMQVLTHHIPLATWHKPHFTYMRPKVKLCRQSAASFMNVCKDRQTISRGITSHIPWHSMLNSIWCAFDSPYGNQEFLVAVEFWLVEMAVPPVDVHRHDLCPLSKAIPNVPTTLNHQIQSRYTIKCKAWKTTELVPWSLL